MPLSGIHSKLARARELRELVAGTIEEYLAGDPVTIDIDVEEADDGWRTETHVLRLATPLPPSLPMLLGDYFHNIRSALDHLMWLLSRTIDDPMPPNDIEFPIFLERARFHEVDKKGKPARGSGLRKMRLLVPDAQRVVESWQPYNYPVPRREPLWLIHNMNIIDKHRTILVTAGAVVHVSTDMFIPTPTRDDDGNYDMSWADGRYIPGPFDDGDRVGMFRLRGSATSTVDDLKFDVLFANGDAWGMAVVPLLDALLNVVSEQFVPGVTPGVRPQPATTPSAGWRWTDDFRWEAITGHHR